MCLRFPLSFHTKLQDWFDDPVHNKESGENRVATVLMYLGEVQEGGETTLPLGIPLDEERQKLDSPSECVQQCVLVYLPWGLMLLLECGCLYLVSLAATCA